MKTEKIIESNKLIAEFMGMKPQIANNNYSRPREIFYKSEQKFPNKLTSFCYASFLLYHTSWDWLMPVIRKIGTIFFIDYEGYGNFDIQYMMGNSELGWHLTLANIDEVYDIVIKFIKWYNKNGN